MDCEAREIVLFCVLNQNGSVEPPWALIGAKAVEESCMGVIGTGVMGDVVGQLDGGGPIA